jgi:TRAP-type C4-dicarboxylate transport system permease small subunit
VAMVLCITSEIVLNAVLQPIAARLPSLNWLGNTIARISAPANTLSQILLVWLGILGSALAFRKRAHLGVDALVRVYPRKVRLALDYLSTLLVGLFSATVLVWGGYKVVAAAFARGSKMPGLEWFNAGWFYLVLIFAGGLNLIYCAYHFLHPVAPGDAQATGPARQDP